MVWVRGGGCDEVGYLFQTASFFLGQFLGHDLFAISNVLNFGLIFLRLFPLLLLFLRFFGPLLLTINLLLTAKPADNPVPEVHVPTDNRDYQTRHQK